MSDLTIYLAQIDQYWEDKEKNKLHQENLINSMQFDESGILILPEMFNTGFSTDPEKNAESWDDSKSIDWLKSVSTVKRIALSTSLIIKDGTSYHNRHVFIAEGQVLGYYDKNYLFSLAGEDKKFTPGNKSTIIDYKDWRIKILTCYDLRFPELSRISKNEDEQYDLLIYVANWPEKRIQHWDKLLLARSIENLTYTIGLNRIGKDGNNLNYNGHSVIVNPVGEKILDFMENEEGIKALKISKKNLTETRNKFGFLNDIK